MSWTFKSRCQTEPLVTIQTYEESCLLFDSKVICNMTLWWWLKKMSKESSFLCPFIFNSLQIFYCMRYLSCLCIILLAIIKNYLALHHVIFQKMKHLNKSRFSTLVNNTFVSLSPAVWNICGHCCIPTLKKERFVNSTYQV